MDPWGQTFRVLEAQPKLGRKVGITALYLQVQTGTAASLGKFYETIFKVSRLLIHSLYPFEMAPDILSCRIFFLTCVSKAFSVCCNDKASEIYVLALRFSLLNSKS